jgi:hypothetical protein
MKTFLEVFSEEFKTEDLLVEFELPISPFVAFAAFKKRVFSSIRGTKTAKAPGKIKGKIRDAESKAMVGVEKTKAATKQTSGGTVYKLTKEQINIMAEIYNKYGKELVKEIMKFRKSVLAPYQLIKRKIKKSSRISSKDIHGMSKEEYLSALESGRKKIENRGKFSTDVEEVRKKFEELNKTYEDLNKLKTYFSDKTNEYLDSKFYNLVNKVYKEYDIEEEIEGFSKNDLRNIYVKIEDLKKKLEIQSRSNPTFAEVKATAEERKRLFTTGGDSRESSKEKGDYGKALTKYFFSAEILKKIKKPSNNVFRKKYTEIIDNMLEDVKAKREVYLKKLISHKKGIEFDPREKKIWSTLPSIKHKSGNIADYYNKLKERDFLEIGRAHV